MDCRARRSIGGEIWKVSRPYRLGKYVVIVVIVLRNLEQPRRRNMSTQSGSIEVFLHPCCQASLAEIKDALRRGGILQGLVATSGLLNLIGSAPLDAERSKSDILAQTRPTTRERPSRARAGKRRSRNRP